MVPFVEDARSVALANEIGVSTSIEEQLLDFSGGASLQWSSGLGAAGLALALLQCKAVRVCASLQEHLRDARGNVADAQWCHAVAGVHVPDGVGVGTMLQQNADAADEFVRRPTILDASERPSNPRVCATLQETLHELWRALGGGCFEGSAEASGSETARMQELIGVCSNLDESPYRSSRIAEEQRCHTAVVGLHSIWVAPCLLQCSGDG
mmetsp:Transcript_15507/g.60651  ORF Transcript_15507/g.60651 Transcript_15507/m.60651 type:complete len:210 (-) Transcript_15507:515-1144(-)